MPNKIIVLIAAAFMAACAASAPKPAASMTASCTELPQWTTKDQQGRSIGVYVCFGEESRLLYAVRVMTLPPKAPSPGQKPKTSAKKPAAGAPPQSAIRPRNTKSD